MFTGDHFTYDVPIVIATINTTISLAEWKLLNETLGMYIGSDLKKIALLVYYCLIFTRSFRVHSQTTRKAIVIIDRQVNVK